MAFLRIPSVREADAGSHDPQTAFSGTTHYTPKHGRWLDMAEIELGILGRQCLDRRIDNAEALTRKVAAGEVERNAAEAKVNGRFTTEDPRIRLKTCIRHSRCNGAVASCRRWRGSMGLRHGAKHLQPVNGGGGGFGR